jgi:hypothetical protein
MAGFLDREGLGIVLVAVLVVGLLAAGAYVLWNPPAEDPGGDATTGTSAGSDPPLVIADSTMEFLYPGEEGRTVLELLKQDHVVALDSELLLFGSIVLQIDSFSAGPDQYWIYYRDTLRGDRSPEVCTTTAGETIRWVLTRRR